MLHDAPKYEHQSGNPEFLAGRWWHFFFFSRKPCEGKLQWLVKRVVSRNPEVLYFADTDDSVLALTIDSPDSPTTSLLLEVLRT